jgi:Domain of unknown function (DUF6570)
MCAHQTERIHTRYSKVQDIPHQEMLQPAKKHSHHPLTEGLLLHNPAVEHTNKQTYRRVCYQCWDSLTGAVHPQFSLGNNLWIRPVPFELSVLTLPEQVLISRFYPVSYIVKLYPKARGGHSWDESQINCGFRGNVSTYRLDPSQVAHMALGLLLPSKPSILAAVISVTLVRPRNVKEKTLRGILQVHQQWVLEALLWLKKHNPIYGAVEINMEAIDQLPVDGIPEAIMDNIKVDPLVHLFEEEQGGYVPDISVDEDGDNTEGS